MPEVAEGGGAQHLDVGAVLLVSRSPNSPTPRRAVAHARGLRVAAVAYVHEARAAVPPVGPAASRRGTARGEVLAVPPPAVRPLVVPAPGHGLRAPGARGDLVRRVAVQPGRGGRVRPVAVPLRVGRPGRRGLGHEMRLDADGRDEGGSDHAGAARLCRVRARRLRQRRTRHVPARGARRPAPALWRAPRPPGAGARRPPPAEGGAHDDDEGSAGGRDRGGGHRASVRRTGARGSSLCRTRGELSCGGTSCPARGGLRLARGAGRVRGTCCAAAGERGHAGLAGRGCACHSRDAGSGAAGGGPRRGASCAEAGGHGGGARLAGTYCGTCQSAACRGLTGPGSDASRTETGRGGG
mmetsp:Transcript_82075/g.229438  ORF Transcript_82075/g.229438 Transcript_82075/m.229438 type:complete len:354 (+) Transcript_82075:603-1664(+)